MIISEVVELTKLTKKAIRYYESVELIKSSVLANGYRDYSKEIVEKLRIIKNLRELSFSIDEIKEAFKDEVSLINSLSLKAKQLELNKDILSNQIDIINNIVNNNLKINDIDNFENNINKINGKNSLKIGTLLQKIFPGDFGQIISAAYSPFLNETILSSKQKETFESLVIELDNIDQITIPEELLLWARNHNNEEAIKYNFNRMKSEYSDDYDEFSEKKKNLIKEYLENSNEKTKFYTNLDLITFLSKEGSPVIEILGKYLPLLSKTYEQFYLKQERFLKENDELINKLNK